MTTKEKVIVEVVEARNVLPKDGHGTSSPYVSVDFYGQRKRTRTVIRDLNPAWNEALEFNAGKPSEVFEDVLELSVFHDKAFGPTRRNNFLGRLRLSASQFVMKGEEALVYLPLQKKDFFSWIQGDIGLKIYYAGSEPEPRPEPEPTPVHEPKLQDGQKNDDKVEPEPQPQDADAESVPSTQQPGQKDEKVEVDNQPQQEPSPEIVPPANDQLDTMMAASVVSKPLPEVVKLASGQPIRRPISGDQSESDRIKQSSFDLVEKMHYVFVRVVRARSLPADGAPFVKISVADHSVKSKPARRKTEAVFEWDEAFAFSQDSPESSSALEVSVWDNDGSFLGGVCFDAAEVPLRDPPDSPLAPQWYRLEGGGARRADLMLATWVGTQADDSFAEAWKTDTAGNPKVYQSPKMWYLRVCVLEAQDVPLSSGLAFHVRAQLGFQALKTKPVLAARNGAPAWNEDLVFVAAEPFDEPLMITLESKGAKAALGSASVALSAVERRVDDRRVASRWLSLSGEGSARVHLRVCFDGGYHVSDEAAHVCSDYRPTARQLWKPPVGSLELGIVGLVPVGRGRADAYCVAKYGPKWVRTRTVSDTIGPRWNEQYTFKVFDPCTVLTLGVFNSCEEPGSNMGMGKVRLRISTLSAGRVYRSTYPLTVLTPAGPKKRGELEVAVRFVRSAPTLDLLHVYSQPLLPPMHHLRPLAQQDALRHAAVRAVVTHLSRSEPPVPREVVLYMLDAEPHHRAFSMRRVRANYARIVAAMGSLIDAVLWVDATRTWKNPTATMLAHALLLMFVWFPDLIFPTAAFYASAIGAWNYRLRARDTRLTMAEAAEADELDEEFDTMPSCRAAGVVRARYDRLRAVGARVQAALGDLAAQGERVQALVTWRDPWATGIFVALCFTVAVVLYVVPSKMVAMAFGLYYLRHPVFRDRMPSPAFNFFRRLPSLSDRIL